MTFDKNDKKITEAYNKLLNNYLETDPISLHQNQANEQYIDSIIDPLVEEQTILKFITKSCGCTRNCHTLFSLEELLNSRNLFRSLSVQEKNCSLITQLRLFLNYAPMQNHRELLLHAKDKNSSMTLTLIDQYAGICFFFSMMKRSAA